MNHASADGLLVWGYIREIDEKLLIIIIPIPVYEICHAFYHTRIHTNIFILNGTTIYSISTSPAQDSSIGSKQSKFFLSDKIHHQTVAYIPSSYTAKNNFDDTVRNKDCHAIFSMLHLEKSSLSSEDLFLSQNWYSPCFMLYEQDSNEEIAKIQSKVEKHQNFCYYDCFKYLDDCHGILATRHHKLYQLKPDDIGLDNDYTSFCFHSLPICAEMKQHKEYSSSILNTEYLVREEMVFAMQGEFRNKIDKMHEIKQYSKCAVFDLSDNTWMMTKQYQIQDIVIYKYDLCHHYMDRYNVYLASAVTVSRYDFCKDDWYHLWESECHRWKKYSDVIAWIDDKDPFILRAIASDQRVYPPDCLYFDMRSPVYGWKLSKDLETKMTSIPIDHSDRARYFV